MQRILLVEVNWRGDVLFSTPFIRAIREKYPDSFIAALVLRRCAPILQNNPHLNELIIFEEEAAHKGLLGKLRLIRLLRAKHFDSAFLLHRSFTRTLICWAAGIRQRIGYYTAKRVRFLTKAIPAPIEQLHKVEYFLNIGKDLGIATENKDYQFSPSLKDKDYIGRLFEENGLRATDFITVINPGGNWQLKRWPKESFARLADKLIKDCQAKVIITGAKADIALAEDIADLMKERPLIFCGRTTLGELAALMARANVVIANDSGPMHIAVSQGTKVVALFGPTSAKITGPYGSGDYRVIQKDVGCAIPCYQLNCSDNRCMKAISVEEVLEAVRNLCR